MGSATGRQPSRDRWPAAWRSVGLAVAAAAVLVGVVAMHMGLAPVAIEPPVGDVHAIHTMATLVAGRPADDVVIRPDQHAVHATAESRSDTVGAQDSVRLPAPTDRDGMAAHAGGVCMALAVLVLSLLVLGAWRAGRSTADDALFSARGSLMPCRSRPPTPSLAQLCVLRT